MLQNQDAASREKLQRYINILDSMTDAELDSKDVKKLLSDQARIDRLARGSGRRKVRRVGLCLSRCGCVDVVTD